LLVAACNSAPSTGLKDGYFTAMAQGLDDKGWQEFLTISVTNGEITTAEFNARNVSGLLRSWDPVLQRHTHRTHGVNANAWQRLYANSLVAVQKPDLIEPMPGGRRLHAVFVALAQAAVDNSRLGREEVALVELPPNQFPNEL
jgi:major membrane immunogen (membrane-anchored lipoprotein)